MINYEMALFEIEMYKKAHESLSENLTHANKQTQQFKAERDKFEQMINEECERGYQMEGKYHDMKVERDTLIDDLPWYKAKVNRLERENEQLKESHIKHITNMENYYKDRLQKLKEENKSLCKPDVVFELQKDLQERCDRAIDLKEENTQLKESRDWDYEYIVKVNEENKRLERENVGLKLMNESSNKQLEIFHRCFNSLLTKLDINKDKDKLLSEISQHIGNKPSSSTYKYFRAKLDSIGIKEGE